MTAVIRNPYARPVGEYVKETAMKNLHVHPLVADALNGFLRPVTFADANPASHDLAEAAELVEMDDLVNANIRQMAGPWPIADKDGD